MATIRISCDGTAGCDLRHNRFPPFLTRSIHPGSFRTLLTSNSGSSGLADAFEVVVQWQTGPPAPCRQEAETR